MKHFSITCPPQLKNVLCLFFTSLGFLSFTVQNGVCAVCFNINLLKVECLPALSLV